MNIAFKCSSMYPSTGYGGRPVFGKFRIALSVVAGVFFGFLLFEASVNLQWFNIVRFLYLILGIFNGFLIGFVEVRTIIRGVNEQEKTIAWQPLILSAVTFLLPLLVVVAVFGTSEYLPFGGYVVLSFVPIYYAVTGWYYYETEKKNNIRILQSLYGFTYWKETVPDYSVIFSGFISDLARKDYFLVTSLTGYAGYAKSFTAMLEAKKNADPTAKKALVEILQVMSKYGRRGLILYVVVMLFMVLLGAWIFVLVVTNTFGLVEVVADRIVSGREVSLVLGLVPFLLYLIGIFVALRLHKKNFEQAILNSLKNVDSDKLYAVL
jgi:hypothetical protein